MTQSFRDLWGLNSEVDFLNHGSFGATPTCVLEDQRTWIDLLEADPIEFLAPERGLEPKLDYVRNQLATLFNSQPECLGWVRNATDGVNAVLRSMKLSSEDEILVTNHGYNACVNAARFVADLAAAKVTVARIPFPLSSSQEILQAIDEAITPRTRILLVDHVTSPTGLVFPIQEIVKLARQRGIRILVDGAHAPGMLNLNLNELDADYYTANHHKWLCGPKVSGFLWVRSELQSDVRPSVISHAANRPRPGRSRFIAEFDWTGTYDPTPLLALPKAIEFLSKLYAGGLQALMSDNHRKCVAARNILCDKLGVIAPAPEEVLGSLATVPVPGWAGKHERLGMLLREQYRFELPVFPSPIDDECLLRVSLQAYNELEQIERLADVLKKLSIES